LGCWRAGSYRYIVIIRGVREELKKYGNEDAAKKFLEELKKKREALAQKRGVKDVVSD